MINLNLNGATCCLDKWGSDRPDTVVLMQLYVQPEVRKQGRAKKLLRCVKKWATRTKTRVVLWVGPFGQIGMSSEELKSFYSKMGWREFHKPGASSTWMEFVP